MSKYDYHDPMDGRHLEACERCRRELAQKAWNHAKTELQDLYGDWF